MHIRVNTNCLHSSIFISASIFTLKYKYVMLLVHNIYKFIKIYTLLAVYIGMDMSVTLCISKPNILRIE